MKLVLTDAENQEHILDNLDTSDWSFGINFGESNTKTGTFMLTNDNGTLEDDDGLLAFYEEIKDLENVQNIQIYDEENIQMFDLSKVNYSMTKSMIRYSYRDVSKKNLPYSRGLSLYCDLYYNA